MIYISTAKSDLEFLFNFIFHFLLLSAFVLLAKRIIHVSIIQDIYNIIGIENEVEKLDLKIEAKILVFRIH